MLERKVPGAAGTATGGRSVRTSRIYHHREGGSNILRAWMPRRYHEFSYLGNPFRQASTDLAPWLEGRGQ